LLMM